MSSRTVEREAKVGVPTRLHGRGADRWGLLADAVLFDADERAANLWAWMDNVEAWAADREARAVRFAGYRAELRGAR